MEIKNYYYVCVLSLLFLEFFIFYYIKEKKKEKEKKKKKNKMKLRDSFQVGMLILHADNSVSMTDVLSSFAK